MDYRDKIRNMYFDYIYNMVCDNSYPKQISYKRLLIYLHEVEFEYIIENDANRFKDGVDLRRRFAYENNLYDKLDCLDGPCSILEMLIALSIRCEEQFMADVNAGNRIGQWFWDMIVNLGLGQMTDDNFDKSKVYRKVHRFMNRSYRPNGRGGLFTILDSEYDLREVEIWTQMCWYLDKNYIERE